MGEKQLSALHTQYLMSAGDVSSVTLRLHLATEKHPNIITGPVSSLYSFLIHLNREKNEEDLQCPTYESLLFLKSLLLSIHLMEELKSKEEHAIVF